MNLESLQCGLNYYSRYTDKVILEVKHMGSRASVYLFSDPQDCYCVSRNGWKINQEFSFYQKWIDKFKNEFDAGLKLRILDAELMPWSVLGRDLIDKSFYQYYTLANNEQEMLGQLGFDNAIENLHDGYKHIDHELPKKEFISKYGHQANVYLSRLGILNCIRSSELELSDLEKFKRQIDLYGGNDEPYILPFDILKDVYDDREELRVWDSNIEKYQTLSDCEHLVISPTEVDKAQEFFDKVCAEDEEGVVIKPEYYCPNFSFAPYLKVRNPEYLRIVYGHDYLEKKKYEKLVRRKNTRNKLKKSIRDFRLGVEMLSFPYGDKSPEFVSKVIEFVINEEKSIDPRL